jgi:hypothetical protein
MNIIFLFVVNENKNKRKNWTYCVSHIIIMIYCGFAKPVKNNSTMVSRVLCDFRFIHSLIWYIYIITIFIQQYINNVATSTRNFNCLNHFG